MNRRLEVVAVLQVRAEADGAGGEHGETVAVDDRDRLDVAEAALDG